MNRRSTANQALPPVASKLNVLTPTALAFPGRILVARGLAKTRPVSGIPPLDLAGIADAQAAAAVKQRAFALGGIAAAALVTIGLLVRHELVKTEQAAYATFDLRDISLAVPLRVHWNKMDR